jgi:hypothetical protein
MSAMNEYSTSTPVRKTCNAGAPAVTLDALIYELRTYGAAQLVEPNCRSRLADLSTPQVRELITRLIRLRPQYPRIDDDLIVLLGGLL